MNKFQLIQFIATMINKFHFAQAIYSDPEILTIELYNDDNSIYKTYNHPNALVVWYEFKRDCYQDDNIKRVNFLSSIDHWFFDSDDDYEEKYFNPETGEWHDWRNDPTFDTKGYPCCVVRKSLNFNNFFNFKYYILSL